MFGIWLVTVALAGCQSVNAQYNQVNEITQSMFQEFATFACSRVITNQGALGCGPTNRDTSVGDGGVLVGVQDQADLDALLANGAEDLDAISIVLDYTLLNRATMDKVLEIHASKAAVTSVIVALSNSTIEELNNPDPASTFNAQGDGLSFLPLPFPVTMLRNVADSESVWRETLQNRDRGLESAPWISGARFPFYMGQLDATSSECLASQNCDPLGGSSVWGTIGEELDTNPDRKFVMLTTGLDSNAFFKDLSFGRNSAASGIAATLLAARAIADSDVDVSALPSQVGVGLFQGEAWGRIGSRRFVSDIEQGCSQISNVTNTGSPISYVGCLNPLVVSMAWTQLGGLEKFSHVFALDQVAAGVGGNNYFWHTIDADLAGTINAQASSSEVISLSASSTTEIPPSPLDSFQENQNWTGIGVVLTGYDTDFSETNPDYHSRFDVSSDTTDEEATATRIAELAQITARSMVQVAGGEDTSSVVVDSAHAVELWSCLSKKFACDLAADLLELSVDDISTIMSFSQPISLGPIPYATLPLFTSVYRPFMVENSQTSLIERFVKAYLTRFNQKKGEEPIQGSDCSVDFECFNVDEICSLGSSSSSCVNGKCVCPFVFYHDALSPVIKAKIQSNVLFYAVEDPSGEDPVYTEPRWAPASLILYRESNNSITVVALIVTGVLITAATWFSIKRAIKSFDGTKLKLN